MKIRLLIFGISFSAFICACNNSGKQDKTTADSTNQPDVASTDEKKPETATSFFDVNSIPVSEKELGPFPFFSLPEGLQAQNKPVERKFDRLFFAIDGKMMPLEGRVWKSNIVGVKSEDWSLPLFERSYDEAIKAAGGVKIFDGVISQEEYDRYSAGASYLGEDGSIGYVQENIKTYIIHRANGGDIYIQLTGNSASGKLDILQQEGFKQTITMLKAEQITNDLNGKGKAVLYINFDTDKSTLKPEGKDAVAEITKTLKADPALKVAINGYTDNTGNEAHNVQLSKDRAKAVLDALVASGIEKARLSSDGFGSQQPIADNGSEEGKAKNRRVELVKK